MYFPSVAPGALGTAVVWSASVGVSELNVVVDHGDAALAFTASGFEAPAPKIWRAVDRSLVAARPTPPEIDEPPTCPEQVALLEAAGLEVVVEHGVVLGEINGLEVARVGHVDGRCAVEIGVGAYDQFASAALTLERDDASALAKVVDLVGPHRVAGAEPHPIGRLVRARWLRRQVIAQPELVGADSVEPIPLLTERPGLNESQPAAAIAERNGGRALVVFAVGLFVGAAEVAAGLAVHHGVSEVVLVMPSRDLHPRIVASVERLSVPASVLALEGDWS